MSLVLRALLAVTATTPSTPPSSRAIVTEHRPSLSIPPMPVTARAGGNDGWSSVITVENVTRALAVVAIFDIVVRGTVLYRQLRAKTATAPRGSARSTNPYETPTLVHEYLLMHYGQRTELVHHSQVLDIPWAALSFPVTCATECVRWLKTANVNGDVSQCSVLDIGCAVGRSSFELSQSVGSVTGLDYSHAFIDAANTMKSQGQMPYRMKLEGDVSEEAVARIDNIPVHYRERCQFMQGDACNLPASLAPVDCLLAANLICRLPSPMKFLDRLPSLIKPNGFVVLFSPHTWLTDYTAKDQWLGGYYDSEDRPVRTKDTLTKVMAGNGFKLVHESNVPFFIRETERKNQWTISHLTVFQKC